MRLTYAFSLANGTTSRPHSSRISLHYSFCRSTLFLRITPAMAAGITDRLWDIGDLLAPLMKKASPKLLGAQRGCGDRGNRPFAFRNLVLAAMSDIDCYLSDLESLRIGAMTRSGALSSDAGASSHFHGKAPLTLRVSTPRKLQLIH